MFPNSQIEYMGDYVQIFFAFINAFHTPRVFDTSDDTERAQKMKDRLHKYNKLYETVKNRGLDSKAVLRWENISDESLPDFPKLTMDELRDITLGVYQVIIFFLFKFF